MKWATEKIPRRCVGMTALVRYLVSRPSHKIYWHWFTAQNIVAVDKLSALILGSKKVCAIATPPALAAQTDFPVSAA
jgi:hypothetical protein